MLRKTLIALPCIIFATAAAGQTTTSPSVNTDKHVVDLLMLMDTDKNGKISHKEFMDFMEAEFQRLDVNKDGELDPSELARSRIFVRSSTHTGGTGSR